MNNISEMPVVLTDGTVVVSFLDDVVNRPYCGATPRAGWRARPTHEHMFQLSALAVDASGGPFAIGCTLRAGNTAEARSS
jgi:hypothetical protein